VYKEQGTDRHRGVDLMSIKEKWSSSIDGRRSDYLHKGSRDARMSDAVERKNTRKNYELQSNL
jgi:hypothetical protein